MPHPSKTLTGELNHILSDIDEALVRLALDTQNDERGIDCLSLARHNLKQLIEKLEEETPMRTIAP